jgi:putative SOS response-associated peptidase YedK
MCGRFTLNSSAEELAEQFDLDSIRDMAPRYNIAPSQDIAVVRESDAGPRELAALRWGLIPAWVKDPAASHSPINARSETAASKPTFRQAMSRRRCIVPASGFFEWKGKKGEKQAFLFRMRSSGLFGIAGLYETWLGVGGEVIETAALLTTEANAVVERVHKRMPVILAPSDYEHWLDSKNRDSDSVAPLMAPCPVDWIEAIPVSERVNNPRFDDPGCIEAVDPGPTQLPLA